MQRATRPLFNFDPGWLFIAAGLVICVSGIILPAQEDLKSLRRQLDQLRAEEVHAYARLKAHSDFMDQVDRADPSLVRRLAAAQLNLVPAGDTPLLLASAGAAPVTDWIDNTVKTDIRPPKPAPLSALGQLANGRHRLWMFGGGIMAVFIGLLLGPSPVRPSRRTVRAASYAAPVCKHRDDAEVAIQALEPAIASTSTGQIEAALGVSSDIIEIPSVDVEVKPTVGDDDDDSDRHELAVFTESVEEDAQAEALVNADAEDALEAQGSEVPGAEEPLTVEIHDDEPLPHGLGSNVIDETSDAGAADVNDPNERPR